MQVQSQQQQQDQNHVIMGELGKGGPIPPQQAPLVLCMPTGIDISQPPASIVSTTDAIGGNVVENIAGMLSSFPSSTPTMPPLPPQMMNAAAVSMEAYNSSNPSSLSASPSSSSHQDLTIQDSLSLPLNRTQYIVTDDTTAESETDDGLSTVSNNRDSFGTTDGGISGDSSNRDSFGSAQSTQSTSAGDQRAKKEKKERGNYKCQRCNVPKKGHICPYQLIYKKQSEDASKGKMTGVDVGIQNEIGGVGMTVRVLDLGFQGFAESYIDITIPPISTPEHYSGIEDIIKHNTTADQQTRSG